MDAIPEDKVTAAELAEWYGLDEQIGKLKQKEALLRSRIFRCFFPAPKIRSLSVVNKMTGIEPATNGAPLLYHACGDPLSIYGGKTELLFVHNFKLPIPQATFEAPILFITGLARHPLSPVTVAIPRRQFARFMPG